MDLTWKKSDLDALPGSPLFRGDERISPYAGDVALHAQPDAVIRSRDPQDIAEALSYCHAHRIPITFSGGRTGVTGAAASEEGVVFATETRDKVLQLGKGSGSLGYAVAEPGLRLGELKRAAREAGYFYPPDPTSYQEACLGGTVSTNATGEDSLLYGPTRKYVRALKVIKADGSSLQLTRPREDHPPETKGTAGYIRWDPVIDLIIGSEGTLGYLQEITVDLLPDPADYWAAIGFFPSAVSALQFVRASLKTPGIAPRALEFMDRPSLEIWKYDPEIPDIPVEAEAAVYWKQEFRSESDKEKGIEAWLNLLHAVLKEAHADTLADAIWVAQTFQEQERFRGWRHKVPATINERLERFRPDGGGKVASDWWVPVDKIEAALEAAWKESRQAGLECLVFGHIGDGHPHINYIAKNPDEVALGKELIRRQCARAVKWGGGVAGEHGLGKLYRDLLAIQHPKKAIEQMIRLKREWDPHWILGRGTLFAPPG